MRSEIETLRWPTNLNHSAIVLRLVQFREAARSSGLPDLAAQFANVEHMPAGKIGFNVVAALTCLLDRAEYRPLARRLEMVAMNLKNLRNEPELTEAARPVRKSAACSAHPALSGWH